MGQRQTDSYGPTVPTQSLLSTNHLQAIAFDLDGALVASGRLREQAFLEVLLRRKGVAWGSVQRLSRATRQKPVEGHPFRTSFAGNDQGTFAPENDSVLTTG